MKLAEEFVAGVLGADLIEPALFWLGIFGGEDFDNIATLELGIEADHFAIYLGASTGGTNFAM